MQKCIFPLYKIDYFSNKRSQFRQPRMGRKFLNSTRYPGFKFALCLLPVSCVALCYDLCLLARRQIDLFLTKGVSWKSHIVLSNMLVQNLGLWLYPVQTGWEPNPPPPHPRTFWFLSQSFYFLSLHFPPPTPCPVEILIQGSQRGFTAAPLSKNLAGHIVTH